MSLLAILLEASALTKLAEVGAALGAAIVVLGAGLGLGKIGSSAMDAMARQPEAANDIRTSMIIIGGLVEGVSLFACIICLMSLFV